MCITNSGFNLYLLEVNVSYIRVMRAYSKDIYASIGLFDVKLHASLDYSATVSENRSGAVYGFDIRSDFGFSFEALIANNAIPEIKALYSGIEPAACAS